MKLQSIKGLEDSPRMELVSMEIDSVLQSNLKNFANPRKRNARRFLRESADEPTVTTPSEASRTSAKLRLSVSRKQRATSEDEIVQPISEEFPLTDKKRALFEPLGPSSNGRAVSPESLLPPPDFDSASYPRGWLVGKKRKLVNVDVVESMRRIAVHEMNRKDREIDGLNEQLEEDARTMEHLQLQLQQERAKRNQVERENAVLQEQIGMLVNMINEGEPEDNGEIDG